MQFPGQPRGVLKLTDSLVGPQLGGSPGVEPITCAAGNGRGQLHKETQMVYNDTSTVVWRAQSPQAHSGRGSAGAAGICSGSRVLVEAEGHGE